MFVHLPLLPDCKPYRKKIPALPGLLNPTQDLVTSRHSVNMCGVDVIEFPNEVSFLVSVEYH